jgi:6-phosphogluconolactonase (cycloisomerase 2 family)
LTVDALGRFLFASDSNGGIYSYSINPNTGVLTANGTEFPTGGTGSISAVVDPSGRFLYSLLPSSAGVVTMAIQGNGSLTQVGSPLVIPAATGLSWIAVDRTGAYLAITATGTIYTASVNRQTGALAQGSSLTGLVTPTMPVFDPTNQYLFVGTNNGSQIETLSFNVATGALTAGPSVSANTNSSGYGDSQLLISSVLQ